MIGDDLPVPQDFDAERALLSTCCAPGATGGTRLDDLILAVDPGLFNLQPNRYVWAALQVLIQRQAEISLVNLAAELQTEGTLDLCGGRPGLFELIQGEEVGRPEALVDRLQEIAARRKAMRLGSELLKMASDPTVPMADVEAAIQEKAGALTGAHHVGRLDVLTWSSFKDHPAPPITWDWEPFFPRVSFGVLASHPGHGKSILMTQIGVAKATGLPLFGYPTGAPGGVGILGLEDEDTVFHRRVAAAVAAYGRDWTPEHDRLLDANLRILVPPRKPVQAFTPEALDFSLASLARELAAKMTTTLDPPALLFIDTLNAACPADENSAQEMRTFIATIRNLHATLGCSVWALHHFRKTGQGRMAPSLLDRLDPELLRGSSAILGGLRAAVQLGWITPAEAGKAELETHGASRLYAILALTKVNDGPLSPWMLLEHSDRAGLWVPTRNGDQALAKLRGGNAATELSKVESILVDIHRGLTREELMSKHWPDDPKAADRLKGTLADLRRRNRWLQAGSMELTFKGLEKVQELGRQAFGGANPDEEEYEHLREPA